MSRHRNFSLEVLRRPFEFKKAPPIHAETLLFRGANRPIARAHLLIATARPCATGGLYPCPQAMTIVINRPRKRPAKPAQAALIKVSRIVQHTPKGRAWRLPRALRLRRGRSSSWRG
jgi:hypothetical protein